MMQPPSQKAVDEALEKVTKKDVVKIAELIAETESQKTVYYEQCVWHFCVCGRD